MIASPRLALAFVFLTVTLDAIGIGLIFPVMPDLIREVTGSTLSDAALWGGVLSTSFAVMQFLFGPVIGALSDRFGRKPVLTVSLAVMSLDYLVLALAPTIWLLLAARIVSGITAATYSTATAVIADLTPPEERGRRFGLIGAGFGVGFVLGPLIGGLLAGIDTRAPFWAAAALAGGNLVFGLLTFRESLAPANRRPFRLWSSNPLGALIAGLRQPALRPFLLIYLILGIGMNVYQVIWPYFGPARFGWSAQMVGLSLALYGLCFAAGQIFLVGPVLRTLGERRAVLLGLTVNFCTLSAMAATSSGALALVLIPLTALSGVTTPALQASLSRQTPADAQGALQGLLSSLNAISMIVAPPLMTGAFAAFTAPGAIIHAPGAPFLLSAALMVAAILLHVATARATPPPPP
jgi:MFS transporter, DHA1 family, tetracycline resistance protein